MIYIVLKKEESQDRHNTNIIEKPSMLYQQIAKEQI